MQQGKEFLALARDLLAARDSNRQIAPLTSAHPDLDLAAGSAIASRILELRRARGEKRVGRKIGFTNRTLWDLYGVHAPIWGDMFDTSVHQLEGVPATVRLPAAPEPRLEPEIVLGFHTAPSAGMDHASILDCIDWVAHGFEIVSSVFPGWVFKAVDCQAAFGLHAALFVGPRQPLSSLGSDPVAALANLQISLTGPGKSLHGQGHDVLDGPIQAVRHLLTQLEATPGETGLCAGDIVTTGTLTDAMPVAPGDTWQTTFGNLALPGLTVTFEA